MSYSVRRVGRQTLIYGAGAVAARAVGFLMLPLYMRLLNTEDFGVIAIVDVTFEVLTIVAGARLVTGVFRFYHKATTEQAKAEVLSTSLLMLATLYCLMGLVAFIGAEQLGRIASGGHVGYGTVIRIASISFVLQGILLTPMAFLRLQDLARVLVIGEIVKLVIQFTLNIVFLTQLPEEIRLRGVFYSNLVATAALTIPLTIFLVRRAGIRFSMSAARDLFRFGVPMVVNQVATILTAFGDRFVLLRVVGESQLGIYSVAFQFGMVALTVGAYPYHMIWDPVRYEVAQTPDRDFLLSRGFRHMNLLLITVAMGVILFTRDVIHIMEGGNEVYVAAAALVPLLVMAQVMTAWASALDIGILVSERTKFVALANWMAAIVSVIGFVTIIPQFGATGAALTCFASFGMRYAAVYYFSQKLYPVNYDWRPVRRLIGLAGAVAIAGLLLPDMPVALSILARCGLVLAYAAGVWRMGVVTPEERDVISRALRNPAEIVRELRAG